jgi:acylphosphatase
VSLVEFISQEMAKEELQARRFVVLGRVQGVGYRNFVEHIAAKMALQGYVRNRRDGSVEVFAMGSGAELAEFRSELTKGPAMARVTNVNEEPGKIDTRYLGDFSIEITI